MSVKTAGLIVIGDEVLKGQVADSNIPFLSRRLHSLGIKLCKVSIIADNVDEIAKEVAEYSSKYDQVITTGGIGPTHDDVTYEGVAAAFVQPTATNEELITYWSWFNGVSANNSSRPTSSVKMSTIPRDANIIYVHLPTVLVPERKFPVITLHNVCILPGLPKYLRAIFNSLEGVYFKNSGLKFNVKRIYLSVFESLFTDCLNEAVSKYNDVTFGSYPKINNPYYKTLITLECPNEKQLENAFHYFQSKLKKEWLVKHGELLGDSWIRTSELLNSDEVSSLTLVRNLNRSIQLLDKCFNEYSYSDIFLSFNGGKDCTVLLHLVHSILLRRSNENEMPMLNAVYIKNEAPFKEVEDFIKETVVRFNLNLIVEDGPLQQGIQNVTEKHKHLKVAILGIRTTDPCGAKLAHIQKTDVGWGNLIRLSPLLHWSYHDVWTYLRELNVPYCSLYDQGYTSLGSSLNSQPNAALKYIDDDGSIKYRPAYTLEDECLERSGRE